MPGPYTLLVPLKLGGGYRDKDTLLADLVAIVNAECKALVAAGADFIQIDEPHHGMYPGTRARGDQGASTAPWRASTPRSPCTSASATSTAGPSAPCATTATCFPTLGDLHASQIVLEFANRGMEDAGALEGFSRRDKELGAGVIDVKAFKAETADDVAERIRAFLRARCPPTAVAQPGLRLLGDAALGGEAQARALVEGARDRAQASSPADAQRLTARP